jgi:hypothetical protein
VNTARAASGAATVVMIVAAALGLLAQAPIPVVTADGVLEFVANAADGTVTVTDRLNHTTLSRSLVCPGPSLAGLTPDEVSAMVLCAGSNELVFLNTAAFDITARVALAARPASVAITGDGGHIEVRGAEGGTVALVALETHRRVGRIDGRTSGVGGPGRPNELVFLGMIHGEHRTSQRFGLDVVRRLVEEIDPDYWLTEMPANRLARAREEFARTGAVAEPRVSRFPEYVDVLFPLSRTMRFAVYGTAAWNHPMDRHRRERLAAIGRDPQRGGDWRAYQVAMAESERQLAVGGGDDPRWIHTDAYDVAQRVQLDVYNARFDRELGTGGWDTINRAHFANITRVLDLHRGEGARILISYGAGHKSWMLPRLRERTDLVVMDVGPFLDRAGVPPTP